MPVQSGQDPMIWRHGRQSRFCLSESLSWRCASCLGWQQSAFYPLLACIRPRASSTPCISPRACVTISKHQCYHGVTISKGTLGRLQAVCKVGLIKNGESWGLNDSQGELQVPAKPKFWKLPKYNMNVNFELRNFHWLVQQWIWTYYKVQNKLLVEVNVWLCP